MGLGDWLRGQLNDTTYGDGWEARQQQAQADLSLRFMAQRRLEAQQRAEAERAQKMAERQRVNDYFDDAVKLATGAGQFDEQGSFQGPTLPPPPEGFPYRFEDIQGMVSNVARANAEHRRAAATETEAKTMRARTQMELDQARAKAINEPDPFKRAKLLADIDRARAAADFTNARLGGWIPPEQMVGLGLRGTNPATGSEAVAVLDWLRKSGLIQPGGAPGGNPLAAPNRGGPQAPASRPDRPAPPPMPESVRAAGGTVIYGGRALPWEALPPYVQADILKRTEER